MLFGSSSFLLGFLPVVVLGAIALRRLGGALASRWWVLGCSAVFYAWNSPRHVAVLTVSMLLNWLLARTMVRFQWQARLRLLQLGLLLNTAALSIYKYTGFLVTTAAAVLHRNWRAPAISFPLGISFFTIVQVMYLLDCYEELVPALGALDYATFVSFFPSILSGPLARAGLLQPQLQRLGGEPGRTAEQVARGLLQFAIGMFKKIVFAGAFSSVANVGFQRGAHLSALEAWLCSAAYTLQIYFDFSGYTDMAIGSARMLGVELPRNFNAPLRSRSIIEFWQRWHITLSNFITTYLYTPIVRRFRKITLAKAALATLLAMTIAGLWHGPSWNFVLFGMMHGAGLVVNQYWRKKKMPKLPGWLSLALTLLLVNTAFVVFRAADLAQAGTVLRTMLTPHHAAGLESLRAARLDLSAFKVLVAMPAGVLAAFLGPSSDEWCQRWQPTAWTALGVAGMVMMSMIYQIFNVSQDFVYFRF
ncbi:MAG: MBOAT family protein [Acidobacteriota bacterium]|nr:MBOAT family protein [Acidobacteriota bacterium]